MRRRDNNRKRQKGAIDWRRWCQTAVLVSGCLAFGYFFVSSSKANDSLEKASTESASSTVDFSEISGANEEYASQNYSKFQHSEPQHARMPCLLCHKREDNSATPKMPGHSPCAGCHAPQFADNKNPICTICHTTGGGVKRFPALRSFNARFDHAQHTRQTNCATCHKPARRGVALSIPSGLNAHTSCFQCHSANAPQNLSSCGSCHQPGRRPAPVSEAARAFAVNFSHAEHGRAENLNCSTCHTVRAGMARGRQVSAPLAAMHFAPPRAQSCASCHNNRRAFGGDDFSDCKRCHEGNRFRF